MQTIRSYLFEHPKDFCARLRTDPFLADTFKRFLRYLREQKGWDSQRAIATDPEVVRASLQTKSKPQHFVRHLDRTISSGRTSPTNLMRFASVFGFANTEAFLSACLDWAEDERLSQKEPVRIPRFVSAPNGDFVIHPRTIIEDITGIRYVIRDRVGVPSPRGDSYRAQVEGESTHVLIKTLSLKRGMDTIEIDLRIGPFRTFLEREQTSLKRLAELKTPHIARFRNFGFIDLALGPGQNRKIPFLVQEFIEGETLDAYIQRLHADPDGVFRGIRNARTWIKFARQLLSLIAEVHSMGVRHGDIRPDNFMISGNRLVLVDFGQSAIITPDPADRADPETLTRSSDMTAAASPDLFVAPERSANRLLPLETAEDLYGIGAVLFWLATGFPPQHQNPDEPRANQNRYLKTYIARELLPELSQYNEGIIYILCQLLPHSPSDRVSHAGESLRTLDIFETMMGHIPGREPRSLHNVAQSLTSSLKRFPPDPLFYSVVERELDFLLQRTVDMISSGRAEVSGTRDDIIASLLQYLATLAPGDRYLTTATMSFWNKDNLGVDGRFLCANRLLALRGVRMRRVFVVTYEDVKNNAHSFYEIIKAQLRTIEELRTSGIDTTDSSIDGSGYYVGIVVVSESQYRHIINEGYHIGIVQKQDRAISLSFQMDHFNLIRKIYVWNVGGSATLLERLRQISELLHQSQSLETLAALIEESGNAFCGSSESTDLGCLHKLAKVVSDKLKSDPLQD